MYGSGAFGEAAFGEIPGGGFPPLLGIVGSMGAVEPQDIFAASGTLPTVSIAGIADPKLLVLVVELELGQVTFTGPAVPPPPVDTANPMVDGIDNIFDGLDRVIDG